jgi:2',3'-cyclic-nucleotide 2'-phosphodiesterase (5'-nucleotidase family)
LGLIAIIALIAIACGSSGSTSGGGGAGEDNAIPSVTNPSIIEETLVSRKLKVLYTGNTGGYYNNLARRYRMFYLEREAARGDHDILILDAGNLMGGEELSSEYYGRLDIDMLNRLGYSAVAFGASDLQNGIEKTNAVLGILGDKLDCLAANAAYSNGGMFCEDYIIKDFGEYKVGIFGVTDLNAEGITLSDPVIAAQNAVSALQYRSAGIIIALVNTEDATAGKIAEIPGVDFVINGKPNANVQRRNIFSAEGADYTGVLEVEANSEGALDSFTWDYIPLGNYPAESIITGMLEKYRLNVVIGYALNGIEYSKSAVRSMETALGDFVLDAAYWYINNRVADPSLYIPQVDFTFTNGGAIFNPLPPGEITRLLAENVMRVPEEEYIVSMSGAELTRFFDYALQFREGGFGVYSKEVRIITRDSGTALKSVTVGGQPIDPARTYTFNVNSYIFYGGDGYSEPNIPDLQKKYAAGPILPLARMISGYIKEHPTSPDYATTDGRMIHD